MARRAMSTILPRSSRAGWARFSADRPACSSAHQAKTGASTSSEPIAAPPTSMTAVPLKRETIKTMWEITVETMNANSADALQILAVKR